MSDMDVDTILDSLSELTSASGRTRKKPRLGSVKGSGKRKWANTAWMEASKWNPMYGENAQYYKRYMPRNAWSAETFGPSWSQASEEQKQNRQSHRMYGRGRFSIGKSLRGLGSSVTKGAKSLGLGGVRKAAADRIRGGALRAIQGSGAYGGMSQGITGRGMYSAPFNNSSESMILGSKFGSPKFSASSAFHDDGGLIISNQEFVTDVYGNSPGETFESRRFAIQPADAQLFPMLSQFAGNFERYELLQCVFHFETQLDAGIIQSSTGQVGDIMLYHHMDSTEPEYNSSTEFLVNQGSVGRVTKGLAHGVECDPNQLKGLDQSGFNYIRQFPADDVTDKDHGYMQMAVSNTPPDLSDQVIGKLFVSYSVKLVKPRVHQSLGRGIREDTFAITKIQLEDAANDTQYIDNVIYPAIREVRAGSKNNIGCELVTYTYPTGTATDNPGSHNPITNPLTIWGVRFPDDLMGYVRITCSMQFRDKGDTSVDLTSSRQVFERFSEFVIPKAAGNVEVVEDRSNFQLISQISTGADGVVIDGVVVNLDISVRVGTALGGVGNYVMMDIFTAEADMFGAIINLPAHTYTPVNLWDAQSSALGSEHLAKGNITITFQSDKEYRGEHGQYPALLRSAELDTGKFKQPVKLAGTSADVQTGVSDGKIKLGDGTVVDGNVGTIADGSSYPDWVPGVSDLGYINPVTA